MRASESSKGAVIVIEVQSGRDRPVVRNTGISVKDVLYGLAHEVDFDRVLKQFPELTAADVEAVIEYAGNAVEPVGRGIPELGWSTADAARVRQKFLAFAEDWDDPAMDGYDAAYAR